MTMVRKPSPHMVGIDLGTSNSSISVCQRGDPRIILLNGQKTMPSVVQFRNKKKDRLVVGANAKKYALVKPEEVFSSIKPLMKNENWRNDADQVSKFTIENKQLSPTDIATEILRELVSMASEQEDIDLAGKIQRAVICVPANTTDEYRKNVNKAAIQAGLGELDGNDRVIMDEERPRGVMLLEEPTAAAIAYGHELGIFNERKKQMLLVYELGDSTFDVTILEMDSAPNGMPVFTVCNTKGIAQLGGDDFVRAMMDYVVEQFKAESHIDIYDTKADSGIPPRMLKQAQQKLKEKCEVAKIEMAQGSSRAEIEEAAFLVNENGTQLNLSVPIRKSDFLERIQPLLDQAKTCVEETLLEKEMTMEDISRVILVGGSTKADWVVDSIKSLYPQGEERAPFSAKDVDVIVSQGAALYGAYQTTHLSIDLNHPLGIDLGTTHSAIARWVNNSRTTASITYNLNKQGSCDLDSSVFVEDDDGTPNLIVGKAARQQGILYPKQLVRAVKREMDNADLRYQILGNEYSPIDISAEILKELLREVETQEAPGRFVPAGIVVTVPYYFNQHQNFNTHQAALKAITELYSGRIKDRPVESLFLGLLAEPFAIGLDYAFKREQTGREIVLVFDLGGSTFDLTAFSLTKAQKRIKFEVLATQNDDRLGGEDFDESFLQWLCMEADTVLSTPGDMARRIALKKIHPIINEAKRQLSLGKRTEIIIPRVIGTQNIDLDRVTRSHFEDCITGKAGTRRDYFEEISFKLDLVLEKARLSERDVDTILLAGGSSQIPLFQNLLVDKFGKNKIKYARDTRYAAPRGAAIYAAFKLDQAAIQAGRKPRFLAGWNEIKIGKVTDSGWIDLFDMI